MAEYTVVITTNAAKERGLDKALFDANTARLAEIPPKPKWNKQQFLDNMVDNLLQRYAKQAKDDLRTRVSAALETAAGSTVTQTAVLLGVDENPYDNDARALEAPAEEPQGQFMPALLEEAPPQAVEPAAVVEEFPTIELQTPLLVETPVEEPREVAPLRRIEPIMIDEPIPAPPVAPASSVPWPLIIGAAAGSGALLYWIL